MNFKEMCITRYWVDAAHDRDYSTALVYVSTSLRASYILHMWAYVCKISQTTKLIKIKYDFQFGNALKKYDNLDYFTFLAVSAYLLMN